MQDGGRNPSEPGDSNIPLAYAPRPPAPRWEWTPARVGAAGLIASAVVVLLIMPSGGEAKSSFWMAVQVAVMIACALLFLVVVAWGIQRTLAKNSTAEVVAAFAVAAALAFWTWFLFYNHVHLRGEIEVVRQIAAMNVAAKNRAAAQANVTTTAVISAPATSVNPSAAPRTD